MNTYELIGQFAILAEMLENGDIDEQVYKDTIESLPVDEVVENLAKMRKNFALSADGIATEIRRLQERKKSLEAAQSRCNDDMLRLLQAGDLKRVKTALFTVSRTSSQSIKIDDVDKLPLDFIKITTTPDKVKIKDALKAGQVIEGCSLEEKESITIR